MAWLLSVMSLVDVLSASREDAGSVSNVDENFSNRLSVPVIEDRRDPIRDYEEPRQEFRRIVEHLLERRWPGGYGRILLSLCNQEWWRAKRPSGDLDVADARQSQRFNRRDRVSTDLNRVSDLQDEPHKLWIFWIKLDSGDAPDLDAVQAHQSAGP